MRAHPFSRPIRKLHHVFAGQRKKRGKEISTPFFVAINGLEFKSEE